MWAWINNKSIKEHLRQENNNNKKKNLICMAIKLLIIKPFLLLLLLFYCTKGYVVLHDEGPSSFSLKFLLSVVELEFCRKSLIYCGAQ